MNKEGDIFDKAVTLLKGLIQAHPFESGNRRTAYVVAESFIKLNGGNSKSDNGKNARTLQGIREGYYTDAEIRKWFIKGEIREFKRA
ncbi:Fic family protein [Candidatus Woesearchaeota archaeon]|nr:Fic family protein [Candidatus Woesearchaeota archaeon]